MCFLSQVENLKAIVIQKLHRKLQEADKKAKFYVFIFKKTSSSKLVALFLNRFSRFGYLFSTAFFLKLIVNFPRTDISGAVRTASIFKKITGTSHGPNVF